MMTPLKLQQIIEAALMVAGRPLSVAELQRLFDETEEPSTNDIRTGLDLIRERYSNSGIDLQEVASGFQFQAKTEFSPWLARLWDERPPRYSRAFLETLALIAYRQPITRAEIEEVRGVAVSSQIIKTLLEREWIRVIGYREVAGKPAIYGTTKTFLDHFNLKALDQLPTLAELKDLDSQEEKLQVQLNLDSLMEQQSSEEEAPAQESIETIAEDVSEDFSEENSSIDTISEDASEDFTEDSLETLTEENSPIETISEDSLEAFTEEDSSDIDATEADDAVRVTHD